MQRSLLRRGLGTAGLIGVIGGSLLAGAPPAQAEIPPPGLNQIAAGGSDTTETFMEAYLNGRTTSTDGVTTWSIQTYNIPALAGGSTKVVPGDADCPNGTITYGPGANSSTAVGTQYTSTSATAFPFPNGSSAGRRFLVDQRIANPDAACLDIARSSSGPPLAGETSSVEYYAFAMDAVSWATQSLYAPATLSASQIKSIYNCTFDNWNQVGGSDMPIQRLLPNTGSGTTAFFLSAYSITSADLAVTTATCPAVVSVGMQENDGTTIPIQYNDTGITGYSAGRWANQAQNAGNPTIDKRDGVRLGGYTTGLGVKGLAVEFIPGDNAWQLDTISDAGRPATVVENNIALANPAFSPTNDFRGIRYLFNVIDTNSPSYNVAKYLIGFDNVPSGVRSPLCNTAGSTLGGFGFARLATAGNPGGSNLAGSRCRRYLGTGT